MQRVAVEAGMDPKIGEEEKQSALRNVISTVAIFGAIILVLRVGKV